MNYLAHLYLSFQIEKIMVGNFIADAVKGKKVLNFDFEIQKGIRLHRKIDEFTDTHPQVAISKNRIREKYRKYSGVVTDMYFDHFLAANWNNYSVVPLLQFTKHCYRTLFGYYLIMPSRMKFILPAMAAGNWLASYSNPDNIGLALTGISSRTGFNSGIETGKEELIAYYDDFKNDFKLFFPELISVSKQFLLEAGE
jgi:acyl carrier protein phosphodiesterase